MNPNPLFNLDHSTALLRTVLKYKVLERKPINMKNDIETFEEELKSIIGICDGKIVNP